MPSDLHKRIVNAIWRGLKNLEIMDELEDPRGLNLTLNDTEERAIENHINRLRNEIAEARACGLQAAIELFRGGHSWKQVIDILSAPYLLPPIEIVAVVSKAQEKIKQEQEAQQ